MIRKEFVLSFYLLLASLFIVSCVNVENETLPPADEEDQEVWFEVMEEEELSAEEMSERIFGRALRNTRSSEEAQTLEELRQQFMQTHAAKEEEIANEIGVNGFSLFFKSATLNYRSVDLKGNSIILSGVVIWAKFIWDLDPDFIVISNHYTIASDAERPSKSLPFETGIASQDGLLVCPDLIGYGATVNMTHPYLCAEITAINTVDMVKAAMNFIKSNGMKLEKDFVTYNLGYSQGGSNALAVHKYIDTRPELAEELRFKGTYCGGGPYDPVGTLEYHMNADRRKDPFPIPPLLPLIVSGMLEGHPELTEGLVVEEFFTQDFLDTDVLRLLRDKQHTTKDICDIMKSHKDTWSIEEILSPKALDVDSRMYRSLMQALEANNLTKDWTPKSKIKLYHSEEDDVVPFLNFENAVAAFPTDRVIKDVAKKGSHNNCGLKYYTWVVSGGYKDVGK